MTDFEARTADWLTVREAQARVLAQAEPLPILPVPLEESLGRALAQDIFATATLPPWDNSAMDGYAVRHRDVRGAAPGSPVSLKVVGEMKAGELPGRILGDGESIRIMTGAPLPTGADAVVRVEDTDAEAIPGVIQVFTAPEGGKDVRPWGQDMREGEKLLSAGTSLGPGQIGLLAATGAVAVQVRRRPLVAILSNGDEIAGPEEFYRVRAGKAIPETNGSTLAAAVAQVGAIPHRLGIARDTAESISERVDEALALGADALVTSGGASMGEHDLFKRVLDDMGQRLDFWRVKMRPGTPFSFATLPGVGGRPPMPVFGLPGNPASSFVTFQIFVRPFLLRQAGHARIHRSVVTARAGEDFRSPKHLTHFFRVTLEKGLLDPIARTTGPQTSGLVRSQGLAQGLAVVPEGVGEIPEGGPLRVVVLDDFGHPGEDPGFLAE
jgi:molybdopterin molybdotransferase